MSATYNFCAGPAMLPMPVMAKAQQELLDWSGQGVSVMEMSHRSPEFVALAKQAEQDIRDLMAIPDNYHVLFMHGGGRGQFAAIVHNFLGEQGQALYLTDGLWSKAAYAEAVKLTSAEQIIEAKISHQIETNIAVQLPDFSQYPQDFRYLHYCPNETVDGIEIFDSINCPWPVIADMSSCIMSRHIDVSQFAVIYAGAQKNIGPSGLSIVIVRDDMLKLPQLPQASIMDYRLALANDSMYNTPPTFAWYLAAEVFKWLKDMGGIDVMADVNLQKARMLYDCIDHYPLYQNNVAKQYRSQMNVVFHLQDESLTTEFLAQAKQHGLVALKGHKAVGGLRASIYNAMPLEGVAALVKFMTEFAKQHS